VRNISIVSVIRYSINLSDRTFYLRVHFGAFRDKRRFLRAEADEVSVFEENVTALRAAHDFPRESLMIMSEELRSLRPLPRALIVVLCMGVGTRIRWYVFVVDADASAAAAKPTSATSRDRCSIPR